MIRLFVAASALVSPFLIAPAAAESARDQYRAELSTPAARERLVVRDIVWRCSGDSCSAPAGASRPAVVCAALARETGPLRSFATGDAPLSPEQLEKCNARAR